MLIDSNTIKTILIVYILILVISGAIKVAIIHAFIKYAARKNADYFDYDYLAEKIAEEIKKQQIRFNKP